jgi:hypothetical protein
MTQMNSYFNVRTTYKAGFTPKQLLTGDTRNILLTKIARITV